MHTTLRLAGSAAAIGLLIILAGCSTASSENPTVFSGSVPTQYLDAGKLAANSTDLVYGEVVESADEMISDLEVTRYDLRIKESLGGSASGTIGVYQTGTSDWILDMPVPQHLKIGDSYLLFLIPMGLPDGSVGADGYGIVGTGAWADANGSLEIYSNPQDEIDYGTIPTKLTLAEAPQLLEVGSLGRNIAGG